MRFRKLLVVAAVASLMQVCLVGAQEAAPRERPQRPERRQGTERPQRMEREGQRFDPQQMNERYLMRVKETLGVSDEEWQVLKPKVEKVRVAQMNIQRRGGGMRMGQRSEGNIDAGISPLDKAYRDLQAVLGNKDASAKDIATKLAALREARKKSEDELAEAKKQLKELLTQRQEAQLVLMGLLD